MEHVYGAGGIRHLALKGKIRLYSSLSSRFQCWSCIYLLFFGVTGRISRKYTNSISDFKTEKKNRIKVGKEGRFLG